MISIMPSNSMEILNLVRTIANTQTSHFVFHLGMVTQCTRFERIPPKEDPRKLDMYIQVTTNEIDSFQY